MWDFCLYFKNYLQLFINTLVHTLVKHKHWNYAIHLFIFNILTFNISWAKLNSYISVIYHNYIPSFSFRDNSVHLHELSSFWVGISNLLSCIFLKTVIETFPENQNIRFIKLVKIKWLDITKHGKQVFTTVKPV